MRINWIILLLTLSSCIDEFPLDGDIPPAKPVIEGLIADQEGDSFIRISTTLSILGLREGDPSVDELNPILKVSDDLGQEVMFCEKSPGLYQPDIDSFKGTIGRSYQLTVEMSTGDRFESTWETMLPGVSVDTVFANFQRTLIPNTQQLTGHHDFFVTVSHETTEEVQFRVESLGIAQVAAILEPPPPGCNPPCAELCYSYRKPINRQLVLGSTDGTMDNVLTLQVATEPYDFHSWYFIKSTTYSLSPQGYAFWRSIADQQEIDGSIFDPQLNEIESGNISNSLTGEAIIGYFGASAVNSDSLFFNRSESADFQTTIPEARSCVDVWRGATLDVPVQFR